MFYSLMATLTILKLNVMEEFSSLAGKIPFLAGGDEYSYQESYSNTGLGKIINNAKDSIGQVGSVAMTALGIVMIIVGAFKIAKALMNHGKEQTSWVINILLIVIGGVMLVSGLGIFVKAGKEGQNTINNWAG